jgi:hypothetical protein
MSILKNAIDSIQVGVEDFDNGDDERRLLSSVRNVYAGLLLLYKEKLSRLSPDYDKALLIRNRLLPYASNGEVRFKAKSEKVTGTVDRREIMARFESLGITFDKETKAILEDVAQLRNDIEHYYSEFNKSLISEVIVKCFVLIKDFISKHLDAEPAVLLGEECWGVLIEEERLFDSLMMDCNESLSKADWKYQSVKYALSELNCPECNSGLVKVTGGLNQYPDIELTCLACSNKFSFDNVLDECIVEYMSICEHQAYMDGDTSDLSDLCPECSRPTFIYHEGCCVSCGSTLRHTSCAICDEGLGVDDQHNRGLCSYHANQRDKDD